MYSFPSESHMRAPAPRTMIGGSPPTDLNARAGESTPPGITRSARCCSARDLLRSKAKPKIYHSSAAATAYNPGHGRRESFHLDYLAVLDRGRHFYDLLAT